MEEPDRLIVPYPIEEEARYAAARRIQQLVTDGHRGYFDKCRDAFVFYPPSPSTP